MFDMNALMNDPTKMGLLQLGASLLQSSGGEGGRGVGRRRIGIGEALGRALPGMVGGAQFGRHNQEAEQEKERLKKEREAIQKQMNEARQFMRNLQSGGLPSQQATPQGLPGNLPPFTPRLPQDLLDQHTGSGNAAAFMGANYPRGLPQLPNAGGLPPGKMYPWA